MRFSRRFDRIRFILELYFNQKLLGIRSMWLVMCIHFIRKVNTVAQIIPIPFTNRLCFFRRKSSYHSAYHYERMYEGRGIGDSVSEKNQRKHTQKRPQQELGRKPKNSKIERCYHRIRSLRHILFGDTYCCCHREWVSTFSFHTVMLFLAHRLPSTWFTMQCEKCADFPLYAFLFCLFFHCCWRQRIE